MKVLGIERIEYTSKKTGRLVSGRRYYVCEDIRPDRGSGVRTDSLFVSGSVQTPPIEIGDEIECVYDRWGHIAGVTVR